MRRLFAITLLLAAVTAGTVARAAPVHDFHAAMAEAAKHYRFAAFYLRTGNAGVAAIEIQSLQETWQALATAFVKAPPDLYATDPEWASTLAEIGKRAGDALTAVDAGDTDAAARHLAPIRGQLVQLRRRNGLFIFADYVEEANRAFDLLFEFRRRPIDFDNTDDVRTLLTRAAVASDWYRRCLEAAPEKTRASEEFRRLVEISIASMGRIWDAVRERDQRRVVNILREIRSADRLLYLRFG